jgi:hypothetical protein
MAQHLRDLLDVDFLSVRILMGVANYVTPGVTRKFIDPKLAPQKERISA